MQYLFSLISYLLLSAVALAQGMAFQRYGVVAIQPTTIPTISELVSGNTQGPNTVVNGSTLALTVQGNNLGSSGALNIDGTTISSTYGNYQITATAPNTLTVGKHLVTVVPSAGPTSGMTSNALPFWVIPVPPGSPPFTFSPAVGQPGTSVTLTIASGFGSTQGTGTITLSGTAMPVTSWNDTTIVAKVPITDPGAIVVTPQGSGALTGTNFTVQLPLIIFMRPGTVASAGTLIEIQGWFFGPVANVINDPNITVTVNGVSAAINTTGTPGTNGWVEAVAPPGVSQGPVVVHYNYGSGIGIADSYVGCYLPSIGTSGLAGCPNANILLTTSAATITHVEPRNGIVGRTVQIQGTNFGTAGTVKFGSTTAATTTWTNSLIRATVPSGTTTGDIVVTPSAGSPSNGVASTCANPVGYHVCGFALQTGAGTNCNGFHSGSDGCVAASYTNPTTFSAGYVVPSAWSDQEPDFFNGYAQQSGQGLYATTGGCTTSSAGNCHPPWAVAGVDYPVGVSSQGCTDMTHCGPGTCINNPPTGGCNGNSEVGFGNPGTATDPTNTSSPNYGTNPAGCARVGLRHIIQCNTTTSSTVNIGPFDFSGDGNSSGIGMGLYITAAAMGVCNIHDNYFVFDANTGGASTTYPGTTQTLSASYVVNGCSALNITNNATNNRNPVTNIMGLFNPVIDNGSVFNVCPLFSGTIGGQTFSNVCGDESRLVTFEYNAIMNCPVRCLATPAYVSKYNYSDGWGAELLFTGSHGDWTIPAWNTYICTQGGVTYASSSVACVVNSFTSEYNTYLIRASDAPLGTCIDCGAINLAGHPNDDTTAGSTTIDVTNVGTTAAIGDFWQSQNGSQVYGAGIVLHNPFPWSVVTACPGQASSTAGAPCTSTGSFTVSIPWTITQPSQQVVNKYPAWISTIQYDHNIYVGNISDISSPTLGLNMTGTYAATEYAWATTGNITDNYFDNCGLAKPTSQTSLPPGTVCNSSVWSNNLSTVVTLFPFENYGTGNNVQMNNGTCGAEGGSATCGTYETLICGPTGTNAQNPITGSLTWDACTANPVP